MFVSLVEEAITAAAAGEDIEVVVVRLDRWGRSLPDVISTLTRLQESGIRFRSLTEAGVTLDGSASSMLVIAVLSAAASYERTLMMNRVAEAKKAKDKSAIGGRPRVLTSTMVARARAYTVLPWEDLMDGLVKLRREGLSYADLADYLYDEFQVLVNPQTVRTRVAPFMTTEAEAAGSKAAEAIRLESDEADTLRIARWLVANPGSTRRDTATGLDLPLYRVEDLTPLALIQFGGYVVPPAKPGKQQITDQEMVTALRDCARDLGIADREPFAQVRYEAWRRQQTESRRASLPSPIAYRRRFMTWTAACETAGLTANELPRVYTGLTVDDIILHLAVWLRSLTERNAGLIEANQSEYRQWLRLHPEAPSEELIRLRGTWHEMLGAACVLEKSKKKLAVPKPVGVDGRRKKPSRALPVR